MECSNLVRIYRCLCDETRLRVLHLLQQGPLCVCHFQDILQLPQVAVSKHLACLRDCGLVTARPEGRATAYSLNHAEALMDLWSAAERLLDATGDAVTLCPNHGTHVVGNA